MGEKKEEKRRGAYIYLEANCGEKEKGCRIRIESRPPAASKKVKMGEGGLSRECPLTTYPCSGKKEQKKKGKHHHVRD